MDLRVDGWVDAQGIRFAYRRLADGDGAVLVCLHGFPDSPGTFAPLAAHLAPLGLRVVAPWLRGYGPTGGGPPRSLAQLGRDALALAEALAGDRPCVLVGHDWGVVASCVAGTLAPARLRALVLLGLPHPAQFLRLALASPEQLQRSWYIWFFQLPGLAEGVLRQRDFALVDWLWSRWSPGFRCPEDHRREIRETLRVGGVEGPLGYYRAIFAGEGDGDDGALYGPVGVPTLALMGADDGCVGAELLAGQEAFWSAPCHSEVLPGCGHFLHLERPAEVAGRIRSFLASLGLG